ncbi:MAG TPA: hypothetical protein VF101_20005 [Gaiellaceae bacterium]
MDPLRLRRPENEAVLAYLETEQLPSWRESDSPWIVDGYALSTHPDLCERVEALAATAGSAFGYLFGRPVVVGGRDVIVAFGAGTHIFCLRLPREECREVAVTRADEPARQPLLRRKQLELEALVAGEWTRVDPWADEAAVALAAALTRTG